MRDESECSTVFHYLKYFQKFELSFVVTTKPLRNKMRETFYGGLKWMCKLFEANGQRKSNNYSKSSNSLISYENR